MNESRISAWVGSSCFLLLCSLGQAQAEQFPVRPITVVLPAGAGTGVDVVGRLGAQKLGELLGQTVVVENVVGASGVIGTQRVVRAKPDGYTLLFTFNQTITMNPHMVANLSYEPQSDLAPVSRFAESPFVWMINAETPIQTFPEMVGYAKDNPEKLAMGVTGYASAAFLGAQLLSHLTGAEFLLVNYTGNFSADLYSNVVQLSMSPAAQVPTMLAAGKVRALAQTGAERSKGLETVPTVNEFLPGYTIDAWYGVWAPAGTPQPVLDTLSSAWQKIAAMPDVVERLQQLSATPVGSTAEELATQVKEETEMWGEVVRGRGLKPAQ